MKGSCLLNFLSVVQRILTGCKFCSFTLTTIKIPLKLPAYTFNEPKGWSVSASNTETNSAAFIMRWERSLKFCNTSGDQKNFTYTVGGGGH